LSWMCFDPAAYSLCRAMKSTIMLQTRFLVFPPPFALDKFPAGSSFFFEGHLFVREANRARPLPFVLDIPLCYPASLADFPAWCLSCRPGTPEAFSTVVPGSPDDWTSCFPGSRYGTADFLLPAFVHDPRFSLVMVLLPGRALPFLDSLSPPGSPRFSSKEERMVLFFFFYVKSDPPPTAGFLSSSAPEYSQFISCGFQNIFLTSCTSEYLHNFSK